LSEKYTTDALPAFVRTKTMGTLLQTPILRGAMQYSKRFFAFSLAYVLLPIAILAHEDTILHDKDFANSKDNIELDSRDNYKLSLPVATINTSIPSDWQITCSDNKSREFVWKGINGLSSYTENFTNPSSIQNIITEIVYKGGYPGTSVNVVGSDGNTYILNEVSLSGSSGVYAYRGLINTGLSSISFNSIPNSSNAQSIINYIERSSSTPQTSIGVFMNYAGYHTTLTEVVTIPTSASGTDREVVVKIPISEITYDCRILEFTIQPRTGTTNVGSPTTMTYIAPSTPTDGCCIEVPEITIPNVSANADNIEFTLVSPSGSSSSCPYTSGNQNGQSFVFSAALVVEVECANCLIEYPDFAVEIDFNGDVCLDDNTQLSAIVSGGSGVYTFAWTGPNGFSSSLQTIDVDVNGFYDVTVFDAAGCEVSTSGYVYAAFDPYIFSLSTEVCEGDMVELTVNADNIDDYQWGPNANNATGPIVTVIPTVPASTYYVTVTNDQGCSSTALATIDVIDVEDVSITGPLSICEGSTTTLSPTTGGEWISSNTNIATVDNNGIVTAVAEGSVSFTFKNNLTDCESEPTAPITVLPLPEVSVLGPSIICEGTTTQLSPTSGGIWTSSNTTIATVQSNGVVSAISEGSVTFSFKSNSTQCESEATTPITINPSPVIQLTGDDEICIQTTTSVASDISGSWTSSDVSIATVSSSGLVTGISGGTVDLSFVSYQNCSASGVITITVNDEEAVGISGDNIFCQGETSQLSATLSGGTWISNNTSVATVNSAGVVTGVNQGSAVIQYSHPTSSCVADANVTVIIQQKPTAFILGNDEICLGETTQLSSNLSGGYWTSNDESIAIISALGLVTGVSDGTTSFNYTSSQGCISEDSPEVTIFPSLTASVDYNGSLCLTNDSQLTAVATGGSGTLMYSWAGPGGFASNDQNISISLNGNYFLTITDANGCSGTTNAFVYEEYEPYIFSLNTTVCEGEEITLSVSGENVASYQWSTNAGNSTNQSVDVIPSYPSSTYSVTVTNTLGCTASVSSTINVDEEPTISISGPDDLCVGSTTQLLPSSGGTWTSSNSTVASIDNNGVVTANSSGVATFTFTNSTTGCVSDPSGEITVDDSIEMTISGSTDLCTSSNYNFTASHSGGNWSTSNTNIAVIDNNGLLTTIASGFVTVIYENTAAGCYANAEFPVQVFNVPTVSLNGPSTICEGENTYVNSSTSGVWTVANSLIVDVSNSGVVTGLSAGTTNLIFTSQFGCETTLSTPIEVIAKAIINNEGPSDLCIGETTSLSSNVPGIWISSNNVVASINTAGTVTANKAGVAIFSFVESSNGCLSDDQIVINVKATPEITNPENQVLCVGDITTITPSTGGTWVSDNTSVATISDDGIITTVGAGSARFTFTNSTTGCSSQLSAPISVSALPIVSFNGPTSICPGELTSISPTIGGTWSSSDISIATINSLGTITGVSPGNVNFYYTSNSTGCTSLPSETLVVNGPTPITLNGSSTICVGETTSFSPSMNGSWTSNNTAVATITNDGQVVGISPGVSTFTFNSSIGCTSSESIEITILALPITEFTGPNEICIGSTTNLTPSTGGVWTSSNNTVATVTNNGIVTAQGVGNAQFTFISDDSNCSNTTDLFLSVFEKPEVEVIGNSDICISETTFLSPSTGGVWVSSNENVATVSVSGVVLGVSPGSATFTFYETGSICVSEASDPITVLPKPQVFFTGDNTICIGETSTLSPSSGGSWVSDNEVVATVTDNGIITAVSQGIAKFTFINDQGCASNETSPLIVFGPPTISIENDEDNTCIGGMIQMLPSSGGVWTSNNESVATIDNNGVVTGIAEGEVTFSFTDNNTGCPSANSDIITINGGPDISIIGSSDICIGETTFLTPTTGGVWESLDPSIATIQNNGLVTGISEGQVRFLFTQVETGCLSDTSDYVTVNEVPSTVYLGDDELCIGETSSISSVGVGTWISEDESVATIANDGTILAIDAGIVRFRFTSQTTGCTSDWSESLIVNGPPTVSISGSNDICIGSNTQLFPSSGGVWVSNDESIAVVNNSGVVTGITTGTAYFTFTDNDTGCSSDGSLGIDVVESIDVSIIGDTEVCRGYTTQLSPSFGGTWESSNPEIASVSNSGLVTGRVPGVVTFTFTELQSGCSSGGTTDPITIEDCSANDFNVALVDQEIFGNIGTNDNLPSNAEYSFIFNLLEKPNSSVPNLIINTDGSYTFTSNKPGKYLYQTYACISPVQSGCPSTLLEINVVDNVFGQSNPVSNLEHVTTLANVNPTLAGNNVNLNVMSNDKCVYTAGCSLDNSSIQIVSSGSNGISNISGDDIIYTPNPGFIGYDTVHYSVCVVGEPSNCSFTQQVITVMHPTANNTITASDDFNFTLKNTTVSGNVVSNDSDPENDNLTVVAQGSLLVPVVTSAGSYYIESNGEYEFTPNATFSGYTEIVYEVCDDSSPSNCTEATLHLQVFDDLALNMKVYLEGALLRNNNETDPITGAPLMRAEIRVNPFDGKNYIPLLDPYSFSSDVYDDTPSKFEKVGPGMMPMNHEILDSVSVFSVSDENAIVDWIFIQVRDKNDYTKTLATRSGLLQRDGDVVDLDGVSPLRFQGMNIDSFYVVVKHRNHLGVMSMKVKNGDQIDFTNPNTPVFNFGSSLDNSEDYSGYSMKYVKNNNYKALWAGDMNNDGKIKFTEPASDQNVIYGNVLFNSPSFLINYDQTYGYFKGDYDLNGKVKYTNPNDDKNMLFTQLLLYPLNDSFVSNYGNLIEQIPGN